MSTQSPRSIEPTWDSFNEVQDIDENVRGIRRTIAQTRNTEHYRQTDGRHLLKAMLHRIYHALDPIQVMREMVVEVRRLLEAERVIIYQFHPDMSGVVVAASAMGSLPLLIGKTITDHCFAADWEVQYKQGRIQSTDDIYTGELSECHVALLESLGIRANLVVPIIKYSPSFPERKGGSQSTFDTPQPCQLWGLMSVQQCTQPRYWQADEISLIEEIAAHVAIALQQADLRSTMCTSIKLYHREHLELTRQVQLMKELVPQRMKQLEAMNAVLREEIRKRDRLEKQLFQEKEFAQVTLQSIGDAVITTDARGSITSLNPAAEQITGWTMKQAISCELNQVLPLFCNDTQKSLADQIGPVVETGKSDILPTDCILITRQGDEYSINGSISPIRNRDGKVIGTVLALQDVTQARELERRLLWQAKHDPLTGLLNRREFDSRVTAILEVIEQQPDQSYVLCYLDLDHFKTINDTCGHLAGDQLLVDIAAIIKRQLRKSDTFARWGGDEFGILLAHCSIEQAQHVAQALVQRIQNYQFIWQGQSYQIGVSIGLVKLNKERQDLMAIINAADAACYVAKTNGGNNVQCAVAIEVEKTEHYWRKQVHPVIKDQSLRLFGQKITPLTQAADLEMLEVLLRFIDKDGNQFLPGDLLLAAERVKQMCSLDQWVVQTFCEGYRYQKHLKPLLYMINLSGASINNALFTDFLVNQIQTNHVPPNRLCFEITETIAITNLAEASKLIHEVKQIGCRFALDDFGSGMSSLAYLKTLPVDFLKIDGSFVHKMISNPIDFAMVDCFNRLGHEMGIQTIAEWVEDQPTLYKLQSMGVDYAQGFEIGEPLPLIHHDPMKTL